jgi:DNA-binding winged helix-turn-helix (wHTH) protein
MGPNIEFSPYRLDLSAERLFRHNQPVPLRPKTWAVLRYLAERPGVLVRKDALVAAVWGSTEAVSDDALTRTVGELRQAIEDDARTPHIIQTVHRRGFRFLAPIGSVAEVAASLPRLIGDDRADWHLAGRRGELAALTSAFDKAAAGERQIVLVTGEPGVGKSALVRAFLQSLRASGQRVQIGWGQCVEHFAGREPYMPVLEAVERVGRGNPGGPMVEALRSIAPAWLAQLPAMQNAADTERLDAALAGTTLHRLVREFATLVETASVAEPLVIALEDLHWADFATVDLIAVLAQRPELARVMIVGTYRPAEAAVLSHPIANIAAVMGSRGLCTSMALGRLTPAELSAYLVSRLGGLRVDDDVSSLVQREAEGNPLLTMAVVDQLAASGGLVQTEGRWALREAGAALEGPAAFRRLLDDRLRLMTANDRELLEAASVAGRSFDVREAAAALAAPFDDVEARCERLVAVHQVLQPLGSQVWPDGTVGGRYVFTPGSFQRVLYALVPPGRRAALHQRIGERLESGFAHRIGDVAVALSDHFRRSSDRQRAVAYLAASARDITSRQPAARALTPIEQALQLIGEMPAGDDAARQELQLRQLYAIVLDERHEGSAQRRRDNLTRAMALAEQMRDAVAQFDLQYALVNWDLDHVGCDQAAEACDRLLDPPADVAAPARWRVDYTCGVVALWRGDLAAAERQLTRVRSSAVPAGPAVPWFGVDPAVGALAHEALRLWLVGHPVQARILGREAVAMAERMTHPLTNAQALTASAAVLALSGRWAEAEHVATRAITLADDHALLVPLGSALVFRGRARIERGPADDGLREIHRGLTILRQADVRHTTSLLLAVQAGACLAGGLWEEGLHSVEAGLAACAEQGERIFAPKLWRLKGDLLLRQAHERGPAPRRAALLDAASASIDRAIALAGAMGARALERRAHRSAARLVEARAVRSTG